jgi:hypothetical protein
MISTIYLRNRSSIVYKLFQRKGGIFTHFIQLFQNYKKTMTLGKLKTNFLHDIEAIIPIKIDKVDPVI